MKKLLTLLVLIIGACSNSTSSVSGSCAAEQYYYAENDSCYEFCADINKGLVYNPNYTSDDDMFICNVCTGSKQYVSSTTGLCTTCSDSQILVLDETTNTYSCKSVTACELNIDCSSVKNTVCKINFGYCVNCLNNTHCGVGKFCNSDNTCESKNIYGDTCTKDSACFTGVCNEDLTCGCSSNAQCEAIGNSIGEFYNTCNVDGKCE